MNSTILLTALLLLGANSPTRQAVIVVVGTPGTDEYEQQFESWAENWRTAVAGDETDVISIGSADADEMTDHDLLKVQLGKFHATSTEALWLVLIGHGTFDGKVAKFNLRGPDLTADELAEWLNEIDRPIAVVNCASSSGPFINKLAGPNRIVVTATKSGVEQNFARFGDFISRAIGDNQFDLDKDEQTSLLEAFIAASSRVEEFYKQEGRLATEHALIDDNGDGKGTPADWFRGVRAIKSGQDGAVDGQLANRLYLVRSSQENLLSEEDRLRRNEIEAKIEALRKEKAAMPVDDYYARFESLAIELSELYHPPVEAMDPKTEADSVSSE